MSSSKDLPGGSRGTLPPAAAEGRPGVRVSQVGTLGGAQVDLFHLEASGGYAAQVLGYGATLVSLLVSGGRGAAAPSPVVLGHETLGAYLRDETFMGATIGRFSNRIGSARFELDGASHTLRPNDGPHHLHGGPEGFHARVFRGEPLPSAQGVGVRLHRVSPAGEEGYPGRLEVEVTYTLAPGALTIDYSAQTDAATIVSLAPHPYFNLRDGGATPAVDHLLEIHAPEVLAIDDAGIPTGAREGVAGTPFDFRTLRSVREGLDVLRSARGGYDHPFVLAGPSHEGPLRCVATLLEPVTGRRMDLETTAPCLQLYSGQHLPSGPRCGPFHGLCLEPQSYPDAPNHASFPSARLGVGECFRRTTVLRFAQVEGN